MSHIVAVQTEVRDIKAVESMCKELGWTFNENATEFRGWGASQHECSHSITIPGYRWDVGLVQSEDGQSFKLQYDQFLERDKQQRDATGRVQESLSPIGAGACKLIQMYAVHKAAIEAKKKGYLVTRKQVGLKIQMSISGM